MMISEGAPFEHIEDDINTLALPSEELSALWLLAWVGATNPRHTQAATTADGR
jgi:hypothetical protein